MLRLLFVFISSPSGAHGRGSTLEEEPTRRPTAGWYRSRLGSGCCWGVRWLDNRAADAVVGATSRRVGGSVVRPPLRMVSGEYHCHADRKLIRPILARRRSESECLWNAGSQNAMPCGFIHGRCTACAPQAPSGRETARAPAVGSWPKAGLARSSASAYRRGVALRAGLLDQLAANKTCHHYEADDYSTEGQEGHINASSESKMMLLGGPVNLPRAGTPPPGYEQHRCAA